MVVGLKSTPDGLNGDISVLHLRFACGFRSLVIYGARYHLRRDHSRRDGDPMGAAWMNRQMVVKAPGRFLDKLRGMENHAAGTSMPERWPVDDEWPRAARAPSHESVITTLVYYDGVHETRICGNTPERRHPCRREAPRRVAQLPTFSQFRGRLAVGAIVECRNNPMAPQG